MENTISNLSEKICGVLKTWESVDTVTVIHFGTGRLDPNFVVSFDVYLTGSIPGAQEREELFSFASMFETGAGLDKDRFLLDDVPVRLEYKNRDSYDKQVKATSDPERGNRDESTYGFYRIIESTPVVTRSGWLENVRARLRDVPESFWKERATRLRTRMEHSLGDLSAALYGDDQLFYLLSLANFLNAVCSLMFAINHTFEPAPRTFRSAVRELEIQPEEFSGRFANLLRDDTAVSRSRKRELAQLIARSMLYL